MRRFNTFREHLAHELKDRKFRKAFEKYDLPVRLAIEIAKQRERHHITQKELAKKLHTSQQTISRIENGTQNLTLITLEKIARVFHKRPEFRFV